MRGCIAVSLLGIITWLGGIILNKTANLYKPVRTSAELSGDAVRLLKKVPPKDLEPFVMDFWEYKVDAKLDYMPVQVFPSGCLVMRFNIRPDHVESVLYGPSLRNNMKGLFYHDWTIFGVAIHPQRAYHLLGLSLSELRDLRVHIDCFWPKQVRELEQRLWDSRNFDSRISMVADFLRRIMRANLNPKADFLNAYQDLLRGAPHAADIGYIAKSHGTSGRTLRRHFLKYLGLGPKQTDRLIRVQNSMRTLCSDPSTSLAALSQRWGFSDQAHLSREFRALTGYTPGLFSDSMGVIHNKSLPVWAGMDTQWRHKRSPSVIRFD